MSLLIVYACSCHTTVINRFIFLKDRRGIQLKVIKSSKSSEHLRPRAFHSCPPMFGHSFYPNFKRPIPSQKWILKQQVRVPLNIPKHSTKITCQCTSPFRHLVRATPKTTRKTLPGPRRNMSAASTVAPAEISCLTTAAWPSSAARYSGVQPRCRGCDADGGAAAAAVEKQSVAA